jgi:hypothetical protein
MWHETSRHVAGIGALALASLGCAGAGVTSGVSGTVSMSPARPGPQRAGEPDTAPYGEALVQLRDAQGKLVARATTDAQGQFTVPVPAGVYQIGVDVQGAALPRCEAVEATVRANQVARVAIVCDSGMR